MLHQPRYMSFLWALVRPFMSLKMRARVHLLGADAAGVLPAAMDPAHLPPCVLLACVPMRGVLR